MTMHIQFFSIFKFFHFSAINDAMDLEVFGMDLIFREELLWIPISRNGESIFDD